MRHLISYGLLFVLFGGTSLAFAADPPPNPRPQRILVRGQVTAFELAKDNLASPATVKVVHVYSGDAKLVGKLLTDYYQPFGNGHSAPLFSAIRPFTVGEVGIWTLSESKFGGEAKRLWVISRVAPSQDLAQQQDSMKLPFEWAELVEKYVEAKPRDRGELLSKSLRSPNPYTRIWVAERLEYEDSKEAGELLDKLVSDKLISNLSIEMQLLLDPVLCTRKRDDWLNSTLRKSVLKNWVTDKSESWGASRILSELSTTVQWKRLPANEAIELLKIGFQNKHWSEKDRLDAIGRSAEFAKYSRDYETAFKWLIELLTTDKNPAIRNAAVRGLARIPLDATRQEGIEKLLLTETDKDIKTKLEKLVGKSSEADK